MRGVAVLVAALAASTASALADDPPAAPVVILRGSSAPPTPWYEPPPEPKVAIETVYVPLYYLPFAYGPIIGRHPGASFARRNR